MQKTKLLSLIEQKDYITANHCSNTSHYALEIGSRIGLKEDELSLLEITALLHDVGKTKVPDAILSKPTGLTMEEYEIIKMHSAWGAEIVEQVFTPEESASLAQIIKHHHERFDGSGYPDGLKDDDIPMLSQIIAVADAYDAMTSDRAYRKAMNQDEALDILRSESGKQFHPGLVQLFINLTILRKQVWNLAK